MDKNTATKLIRDTFHNPFDKERYVNFVKNLLNTIDESKAFSLYGQYVPEKFREFVKGYERIGTFIDPEGLKVDVLIVYLKNEATLARARTSQRNFIANYLKSRDSKDAGLIAFVSPNPEDWRFSFVKMDYKMVEKKGAFKAEEDFTPARRYSFLVGAHESSHTAQRQLLPILADDKQNPTLSLIEEAFNIETVTKEFFEKYRDLFLQVKEALDELATKNKAIKKDFEEKGVQTADFAKKLLGQIVFLYFLQKKGWFGVERDAKWGTGPKDFLRKLFDGGLMEYTNFFNDVLEPLFYEALAVERDSGFYSKFRCKIPFLNGGLFDPINSYDWVHTDVTLPNDLFSNEVKNNEGDTGTGILDIFDRYNFTVKEDEPLEKEVAVDPEMLGKVFENLLEVRDRKSKGTYYTPREIVHYMCQESIINYLTTDMEGKVTKEDIAVFIRMGDTVIEHESRVVQKGEETSAYSFKLPESIRTQAALIDQKLADIRVCDPAIGSGAFPVGMMNEIVRARQTLTSYLPANGDRLSYDFKRHAIQESLYGVDIDSGAVEIAKLRLWLSLIVDEDDIARIKPLPNLDYRIMQGNSLLEEFEGIKLFDEKLIENSAEDREMEITAAKKKIDELQKEYITLHSGGTLTDVRKEEIQAEIKRQQIRQKQLVVQPKDTSVNIGMFDAPSKVADILTELKKLHRIFFEATQRKKKEELKNKIEKLEWELIETSLTESNKGVLLSKLKSTRTRPFFLWKLYFFEVFQTKGGFDIVIGNPPYLNCKKIPAEQREYFWSTCGEILEGDMDLYQLFYYKAIKDWMKIGGNIAFISPDSFFTNKSFSKFRNYLLRNIKINCIISFPYRFFPFKHVNTETAILEGTKERCNTQNVNICVSQKKKITFNPKTEITLPVLQSHNGFFVNISEDVLSIIKRTSSINFNEYFCISNPSSLDRKDRWPRTSTQQYKACVFSLKEIQNDPELASICENCITGDKILRYSIHGDPIFTNIHWGNGSQSKTINHSTMQKMKDIKLVGQRITGQARWRVVFSFDEKGLISMPSVNIINCRLGSVAEKTGYLLALLTILNSYLYNFLYKNLFSQTNTNITSEVFEIIPIPKESFEEENIMFLSGKAKEILSLKNNNSDCIDDRKPTSDRIQMLEQEIDRYIYKLYSLTPKEIELIEYSKK